MSYIYLYNFLSIYWAGIRSKYKIYEMQLSVYLQQHPLYIQKIMYYAHYKHVFKLTLILLNLDTCISFFENTEDPDQVDFGEAIS